MITNLKYILYTKMITNLKYINVLQFNQLS